MSYLEKLYHTFTGKKPEKPAIQLKNEPKKRISARLKLFRRPRIELEMERLHAAVIMAQNPENPKRLFLYDLYHEILKDAHLLSQIRTAVYTVQQSKFVITDSKGNEKPELHDLFEKTWFVDFLEHTIMAEFWGHSLVEFGDLVNGQFDYVKLIKRQHVKPETGEVLIDINDTSGIEYRQNATKLFLIETGNPYSLGLLEVAAREIIWKIAARNDWAQASERFGMPLLAILSDSTSDKELDEMERMASNFGTNGYVILNRDSDVKLVEKSGTNIHQIYLEKARFCDEQISKLINGQTMTSDEGSSYAQANVHERILNNYTLARLMRIQNSINDTLMPFLAAHGLAVADCKLMFYDTIRWYEDQPDENEEFDADDNESKKKDFRYRLNRLYI